MKILKILLLTLLLLIGVGLALNIFGQLGSLGGKYLWYAIIIAVVYFVVWALVPWAFGLQRKQRIEMFKKIALKYNLKHEYVPVKYFNEYGVFNSLSGSVNGHQVKVWDDDRKPSAIHGLTGLNVTRGQALESGPQKTYYEVDGEKRTFPQHLDTFVQASFAKWGYSRRGDIEEMIDKIK